MQTTRSPLRIAAFTPAARPARTPARDLAARDLGARLRAVASAARRVRKASDDRAIHDLRVATRRLTSAIDLWQPVLRAKPARRVRHEARRIRRDLARHRDLQVLRAECAARQGDAAPEVRIVLELLVARVGRRLAAARRDLPSFARAPRVRALEREVKRALQKRDEPRPPSAATLAERHIADMRKLAFEALDRARRAGDDVSLHAARVRVKRWRYAEEGAERANSTTPSRAPSPRVVRLRELQDALGRVQDLALLRELGERRLRRAVACGQPARARALDTLLAQIAAEREAAADLAQRRSTTLREVRVLAPRARG